MIGHAPPQEALYMLAVVNSMQFCCDADTQKKGTKME